jgi:Tol biopolymer transport system component
VRVVFSEPVDPASVTGTTLRLLRGGNLVPGEIEVIDGGLAVGFEAEGGLQSGAGYTLMVGEGILDSDGSPLEAPITAAFTTEVGGEAVGLRFEREPEHGISGMIFRSSVVVVAVDALGRPAAGFTGRITLGLGNNPGGGTLLGTTAAGGQPARFADLRVNAAGSGYTLVASAPSLPSVTSAPFDVVPARDLIVLSNRLRTFPYDLGLFVLSADGHGAARIPVPFWATAPDWSPDGSRIVFQRPAGGIVSWSEPDVKLPDDSLYVVNPDGSGLRSLQVNGESPRWSPDGRRILYSRVLDGAWDIDYTLHVINADGSGVRSLGQKGAGASWSPDGTRIAISGVVQESGGYPIHVMNADGSRVTNLGVSGYPPVWSPDGRRIAFSRDSMLQGVRVGQNVYVMNADGSGVTNLTARYHDAADPWPDMNRDPDWSPDGSKIVYIRSEDDLIQDYFIHVMNADGSGAVRIPVPAGAPRLDAVAHPSWGPR